MPADPQGTIAVDQPTYQREGNPRLVSVDARATSQDFGGGQGLNELARGLDTVSSAAQEVSDKRDALYAQQVATKAEVDWRQNMAKAEQAFTLDPSQGVNYADKFKQQFNDYQQQTLDNNPDITQNAKNLIQTHLNSLGASMFGSALSLQAKASTDWSIQSFQNSSDNIKTAMNGPGAWIGYNADGSPDTTWFTKFRDDHVSLLKNGQGVVPDGKRREENIEFNVGADKAEIDTSTESKGALQTAQWIRQGYLGTSLTIPQRLMQVEELERQGRIDAETTFHASAQKFDTYLTGLKDGTVDPQDPDLSKAALDWANASGEMKKVNTGIAASLIKKNAQEGFDQRAVDSFPVVDKNQTANDLSAVANKASQIGGNVIPYDVNAITANYGIARVNPNESPKVQIYTAQEASQKAQELIKSAQDVGLGRQKMLAMPPQQAQEYLAGCKKAGVNPNTLEDLYQSETQRQKLLAENPARVALTDNTVFQANRNAETITQNFLNPGILKGISPVTAQQVQGANADAISKIYAFQDQVGSPHVPLTNEMATSLANTFKEASAKSPESAIQLKNQLKSAYPQQYLDDVVHSIPLDSKLSLFMGLPGGSQQERNFAEALSVTDKDKNIGEKTKDALDEAFDPSKNSDISNFLQSQISNGYTGTQLKKTISDTQSALRDYATVLAIKNKSNDISGAINQAPKDVLGTIFGYTTINGQTVAIPRNGTRSDTDISNISQGLQLETDRIFNDKAETQGQNLDLTGALDRYHYQESDDNHKMAINDLKHFAYWSTGLKGLTKDNEAVLLGFDHYGNRFPILDKQGQAITRDLDTMGNNWLAKQAADKAALVKTYNEQEARGSFNDTTFSSPKNDPY